MSDFDQPDMFRTTRPIARKRHTCCECGGAIQPGEQYENTWGVWDGESQTFKTCSECEAIRTEIYDPESGFVYGCLLDDLDNGSPDTDGLIKKFKENQAKRKKDKV